ncbi:hypothetical protein PsYK624_056110 [Phanerochaete sordida]|uniref:Uncharacterized protein n=1 Tax=Phanerochaete sordida TaxID=48140 RepID=A0A9P3G8U3_9APHY|nr:hypothetical protein PsYK624_056110 [Phanerochaete sordida]
MARKRRQSVTGPSSRPPKRRAQHKEVIIVDSDDDDMEVILAQIKQQEQSEALARQLQTERAGVDQAPQAGPSRLDEPILISDESSPGGDEALARKLQAEWAAADAAEQPLPSAFPTIAPSSSSRIAMLNRDEDSTHDSLPSTRLVGHKDLFVGTRQCAKCQTNVPSPRGYVVYSSAQLPPMSLVHLLHATCPSCQCIHCRGCFKVLDCRPGCKGRVDDSCQVLSCCAEIRAVALFEALGGFDRQCIGERAMSNSRAKETASTRRKTPASTVGPGGTGYATGSTGGFDFYELEFDDYLHMPSAPRGRGRGRSRGRGRGQQATTTDHSTQAALAAHWDEIIVRALKTVTSLLPAPYADEAQVYDMLPHPSITALLQMSQLPELLASLLRNDSITDWTARSDLYNAMLLLLRRMADCELTLEVLVSERHELFRSGGLEEWMWSDAEIKSVYLKLFTVTQSKSAVKPRVRAPLDPIRCTDPPA